MRKAAMRIRWVISEELKAPRSGSAKQSEPERGQRDAVSLRSRMGGRAHESLGVM